jgi:hypothetical protein
MDFLAHDEGNVQAGPIASSPLAYSGRHCCAIGSWH